MARGDDTADARMGAALVATALLDIHALVTGIGKAGKGKQQNGRR